MIILMLFFILLLILIGYVAIKVLIETYDFFILKRDRTSRETFRFIEVTAIVFNPLVFLLSFDAQKKNDCCTDSAFFSPEHTLTIYLVIAGCAVTYLYSSFRKELASPFAELAVNAVLVMGVILNIFIIIQSKGTTDNLWICLAGNIPVILLFLIVITKNQRLLQREYELKADGQKSMIENACIRILRLNGFVKFPLLLIICVPLLCLLSVLLYVFGQRPDSAIRAFTDTYKHGLSQLDYMCNNIDCGGHYLCSVAAKGHKGVVKPIRFGERNGNKIICNRQLLISNAFEELIEERWPVLHSYIRNGYDKVGDCVHKYYRFFNIKIVSDIVFIMMKPIEWFFLGVLYIMDRNPENRINLQYTSRTVRKNLNKEEEEHIFF